MLKENVPKLKIKAIELMPIAQKELQKKLNLSSQDTSRLMQIMLEEHCIKREKTKKGYIIKSNGASTGMSHLLNAQGIFAPCVGCIRECAPEICNPITEWVLA